MMVCSQKPEEALLTTYSIVKTLKLRGGGTHSEAF